MFRLKYRYCKARMTAYLNGELAPRSRQRMARYIDECPDCYTEYQRQRALVQDLKGYVPAVGRPQSGQLDRMWANIQSQIGASVNGQSKKRHKQIGFGLVALVLVLMLLPWITDNRPVAAIPSQPAPSVDRAIHNATDPASSNIGLAATAVVLNNANETDVPITIDLRNTPVPGTLTVQR